MNQDLLEKLLYMAKQWEQFEDDTRCDCASHAYERCAEDLREFINSVSEPNDVKDAK